MLRNLSNFASLELTNAEEIKGGCCTLTSGCSSNNGCKSAKSSKSKKMKCKSPKKQKSSKRPKCGALLTT